MIATMTVNKPRMEASAKNGFTNATDAADYLVNHGVPFRDAHGIVGQLVLKCIEENISSTSLVSTSTRPSVLYLKMTYIQPSAWKNVFRSVTQSVLRDTLQCRR